MTRQRIVALSALAVIAMAGAAALGIATMVGHAVDPPPTVTAGDLKDVAVLQPDDDPQGLVVLVSDRGGAGPREAELTRRLLAAGMLVLPVDFDTWRKRLDASDGECNYLGSDLEDIAKETLRTIELDAYHHPLVVGVGEGGTLAYAALADAPVATLAGAVALDPTPTLDTRLPTCPGAVPIVKSGNGFAYGRDNLVPGRATLVSAAELPATIGPAAADPVPSADGKLPKIVVEPDAALRMDIAVEAATSTAREDARAAALPVVDIPSVGAAHSVVVFYSGDGGWRDIDKSIGDELAKNGVHVVGVDSLRYFWSERSPQEIADDTAAIVAKADPSGKLPVGVFGYSFGADTFPFAWDKLPEVLRGRIAMVALLGTEKTTRFQVSVGGWLGLGGDQDVAAAIASIPSAKVVCVHGTEESETACTDDRLKGVDVLKLDGGHHFDGDYESLAAHLLDELTRRTTAAG